MIFRVETDIAFGNRHGATTLLVFSGATSEKQLNILQQGVGANTTERELLPTFCVKDVGQFFQLITNNSNS
jgi:ribonucleotide monophosphatase NagD (HAD superfamily)